MASRRVARLYHHITATQTVVGLDDSPQVVMPTNVSNEQTTMGNGDGQNGDVMSEGGGQMDTTMTDVEMNDAGEEAGGQNGQLVVTQAEHEALEVLFPSGNNTAHWGPASAPLGA